MNQIHRKSSEFLTRLTGEDKVKVKVAQSCLTLCNPMDCTMEFSRPEYWNLSLLQGIFPTQGSNQVSYIAGGFFTSWATRETHVKVKIYVSQIQSARLDDMITASNAKTSMQSLKEHINSRKHDSTKGTR